MLQVTSSQLKHNMAYFLKVVKQGQVVTILQGKQKKPVAKISPIIPKEGKRILGKLAKFGPVKFKEFKFKDINDFLNA